MVFVYFTIIIICSQIIAKKLDIVIFVLTAVVGILVVVFTLWEADAFNEIPIMGIATVIFGHILYETYDEFEIFKNMVEKGFPPIVFELCN
jgi:hypothetical protein